MDFVYKGRYTWDIDKAENNPKKHLGVTFEDAAEAFEAFVYVEEFDEKNSSLDEERYNKTVFASGLSKWITISYTMRDDLIRIFSAREASPHERKAYEQYIKAYYGSR
jgi:uncharacterized DUF497 family protein